MVGKLWTSGEYWMWLFDTTVRVVVPPVPYALIIHQCGTSPVSNHLRKTSIQKTICAQKGWLYKLIAPLNHPPPQPPSLLNPKLMSNSSATHKYRRVILGEPQVLLRSVEESQHTTALLDAPGQHHYALL